jgi:hypothetical protein
MKSLNSYLNTLYFFEFTTEFPKESNQSNYLAYNIFGVLRISSLPNIVIRYQNFPSSDGGTITNGLYVIDRTSPDPQDPSAVVFSEINFSEPLAKYYFAKQCPSGLEDKGRYGFLLRKDQYAGNPFDGGVEYNSGWNWTHPKVCYGVPNESDLDSLYNFTTTNTGLQTGFISNNQRPALQTGLLSAPGNLLTFNSEWSWKHPYLQKANNPNGYYIADETPGPIISILTQKNNTSNIFPTYTDFNDLWKWVKTKLVFENK